MWWGWQKTGQLRGDGGQHAAIKGVKSAIDEEGRENHSEEAASDLLLSV